MRICVPSKVLTGIAPASRQILSLTFLIVLSGCAAHVTNDGQSLDTSLCHGTQCAYDPKRSYRFDPDAAGDRDTLVVLTMSGGGVRASALAYGTLVALSKLPAIHNNSASLLDDVDIISSVSGGSATAGWYARYGRAGLNEGTAANQKMLDFLHADGIGDIAWHGLNPVSLLGYGVTSYSRSDVLADYFGRKLVDDTTYSEVLDLYERNKGFQPFVILNATDVGHEIGFPFTQSRFDLICSDLSRYRLADAIAASANFPMAFSATGIKNYSRECARLHASPEWVNGGPPVWISHHDLDATSVATAPSVPAVQSSELLQLRAARLAQEYIEPPADDTFIHLLDGGLVDNLGIHSTLSLEDTQTTHSPGLYQRLHFDNPYFSKRYEKIKNVVYIVVNARTRTPTGIDNTVYPPDLPTTLFRVIDTPIDSGILEMQNYLTAELEATASRVSSKGQQTDEREKQAEPVKISGAARFNSYVISIDFEMIPVPRCRSYYWSIGTTWTLKDADIQHLVEMPKTLLRRSEELKGLYGRYGKDLNSFFDGTGAQEGFVNEFAGFCT